MSMKRNADKRTGFLSRLIAVITGVRNQVPRDIEETPSSGSGDSDVASIGLPGSKRLFSCSTGASQEIAHYDKIHDEDAKQKSSDDNWI